jgi:hypothetical protein
MQCRWQASFFLNKIWQKNHKPLAIHKHYNTVLVELEMLQMVRFERRSSSLFNMNTQLEQEDENGANHSHLKYNILEHLEMPKTKINKVYNAPRTPAQ